MTIDFTGQVVVVTGAGGGLGRTYALEIARRGGAVIVNDLGGSVVGDGSSPSMADTVVEEIVSAGGRAIANYDSVATSAGGEAIVTAAVENFGRLDALINNAGNLRNAPFAELTEADRDAVWASHLAGAFNVTQPAFRQMVKQRYGRIVFASSAAGLFGNAEQTAYAAAKGGVIGLMNALSQEGAPYGILCNALAPSAVSRMGQQMSAEQSASMGEVVGAFASALDPSFVTPLVVYLASRACNGTHAIYSATGGRFSRIFIGLAEGWLGPRDAPATVEEVHANIDQIRDIGQFDVPDKLVDEFIFLSRQIARAA